VCRVTPPAVSCGELRGSSPTGQIHPCCVILAGPVLELKGGCILRCIYSSLTLVGSDCGTEINVALLAVHPKLHSSTATHPTSNDDKQLWSSCASAHAFRAYGVAVGAHRGH